MAEPRKPEPTEVILRDLKVLEFFDPRLIGLMEQEVKGARFAHFCLYVTYADAEGQERFEDVTIGHFRPNDEKAAVLGISAQRPETLSSVVKVVNAFLEGRKRGP